MDIGCADGNQLPYLGYAEVDLVLPKQSKLHHCIVPVTPDSRYNHDVPLLLGTHILCNILASLKDDYGAKCLQVSDLTTPWFLTFRCLQVQEKELRKNSNSLGIIRNGEAKSIIIPPISYITLTECVDKELPYKNTPVMLHTSPLARDSKDFDAEPTLFDYHHQHNGPVMVRVSNITTRTINIPPRA